MRFQNHVPNFSGKKRMKTSESRVFRHNSVRSKKTSNGKNVYKKLAKGKYQDFTYSGVTNCYINVYCPSTITKTLNKNAKILISVWKKTW